jgi:GNAT superfamily N-acetyltransferase
MMLRPGTERDLRAVGALHYHSRATAYAQLLSPAALDFGSPQSFGEWWAERWRWERHSHRLTVAVDGDAILGFTYLGPSDQAGVMELAAIHVDPAFVGTGVGRSLMLDALPHLGQRAVLWVLAGNERARRFYEAGGWAFDGTTRDIPMGGEMTHQLRYSLRP